ncbi:MAG TPA: TolC family protein [Terriglobia bacterium]|nr:TolC family protein [Terriglobia bacterium]
MRHKLVNYHRGKAGRRTLGGAAFLALLAGAAVSLLPVPSFCQQALTWEQVRDKFEAVNPTLKAAQINIDESRANEVTAYLRPNPDLGVLADGTQLVPHQGVWQPLVGTDYSPNVSYLHERRHKRELRLESAKKATDVATSQFRDQDRTLLSTLRSAFVLTLQQKALLALAKANLDYYDKVLSISRERFRVGDMAKIDLDRLELQRVQYESDLESAKVALETAKIQVLMLLNDRTPADHFDVTGPFDSSDQLPSPDELHRIALDTRPDLKAAIQAVDKAKTDHQLAISNGSTDPTYSVWYTYNPSFNNPYDQHTIGFSVNIPLRIFDRNQGEKARTLLDIGLNERQRDAAEAQVFSDVDTAYANVESNINLLRPYKEKYLAQAVRVRDTVTYSFQRGAASLLDFLNAESDYRSVQVNYLTLIGAYLTAVAQLNEAVGRETIP